MSGSILGRRKRMGLILAGARHFPAGLENLSGDGDRAAGYLGLCGGEAVAGGAFEDFAGGDVEDGVVVGAPDGGAFDFGDAVVLVRADDGVCAVLPCGGLGDDEVADDDRGADGHVGGGDFFGGGATARGGEDSGEGGCCADEEEAAGASGSGGSVRHTPSLSHARAGSLGRWADISDSHNPHSELWLSNSLVTVAKRGLLGGCRLHAGNIL